MTPEPEKTDSKPSAPPMVVQGVSAAVGWSLCIVMERVLKIDPGAILWTLAPTMVVVIVCVSFLSRRFTSKTGWLLGIGGWVISLSAVWFYLQPALQ